MVNDELRTGIRKRRPDIIIGLILTVIVLLAIAWTVKYLLYTDPMKARRTGLPLPVQTLPAAVSSLNESIGASGTIEQSATVTLATQVVSKMLNVSVDVGSVVKEGDVLAELDDRLFRSNLQSAKFNHEYLMRQLQRMVKLGKKGYGSTGDVEKARFEEAAASQAVLQAEIDLANTRIISPTTAIVLERNANPGETTTLGNPAFKLGAIEQVVMVAQAPQDKIAAVRLGMQGDVGTDAFPGIAFKGEVVKIDGQVNDATRTFGVYIKIANPDLRLKPGITGFARLVNERTVLAIPSTAVSDPVGDQASLFVVDNENRARLRKITRGITVGGMTEVLEGVREGEKIVTVGQLELHDNDRVRLNESAPWNR